MKRTFVILAFLFSILITHQVSADTAFALSQNNIKLKTGESMSINIYGSGGYYIANNSNPTAVEAFIAGPTLMVSAFTLGGSNITVCQDGSHCGSVYVYMDTTGAQTIVTPTLSNFTVSSRGPFMKAGSLMTINFNTNVPVVNPYIMVNGQKLSTTGTGSGSYSASYTITGSEPSLIPAQIHFADAAGNGADVVFSLGTAVTTPIPAPTPIVTSPIPTPVPSTKFVFTKALSLRAEDTEVTELQKKLTALGMYSGPITGTFGSLTEAAVKKFQIKNGLSPLGSVGPGTRAALNK
ncbi:MAG: putative peptidoglycan-binding protein [Parcubacteria group bacterium]|nr:putative peptidoglycan-binding protein [Parcubacteria group bacterium]